jgi:starch synthase (maltosyl-transferring)
VDLDFAELGLEEQQTYQVQDMLTDARYLWQGAHNFVELNPLEIPAHIFQLRRKLRTEQDFDYFA